ncbi:hypothetical protein JWG45_08120 [Leptospira sp. 201903070]|uniref:Uncharacterized protein n=1 Tax=Leptospira ainlahdjerensis TaxID=2810033 RepID=A0ABS2UC49_9LEPT|nr:hypothetical protein [Leptospira ainlahdjerensis]MBM9577118.1 hypothetical protein [Leptospira ainlahdjerensis]
MKEAEISDLERSVIRKTRLRKLKKNILLFFRCLGRTKPFLYIQKFSRFVMADLWILNQSPILWLLGMGLPSFYLPCLVIPEMLESPTMATIFFFFPIVLAIEWFRWIGFRRILSKLSFSVYGFEPFYENKKLEYYQWFELKLRIEADHNQEAIEAIIDSFCIISKKRFYAPYADTGTDPRKSWSRGKNLVLTGSGNSRIALLLVRDLFRKLDRLNRFESSIRSVSIEKVSGPIYVDSLSNQSND